MKKGLIFSFLFLFALFFVSGVAYAAGSGFTFIDPSKSQFESAKSPKYTASNVSINASISVSGEVDIYHYEAPREGFYAFYKTGTLDTVGALYEHQNFLWWTTSYKFLQHNDDYEVSQFARNFRIVVRLTKGENYYIAVRGYGTRTGDYTLKIEPNKDDRTYEHGGVWQADYMPNSAALLGQWTSSKTYYNPDQVEMYYLMLDNDAANQVALARDYMVTAGVKASVSVISTITGKVILLAVFGSNPAGWIAGAVGITAAGMAALINSTFDSTLKQRNDTQQLIKNLLDISVTYSQVNGVTAKLVHSDHGLMIKKTFINNSIPAYSNSYSQYDSNILIGENYYTGTWS